MAIATKTNPELWERCKRDAKARMGGKHSARAMQLATQLYKKRGGGYSGKKPSAKNNSLKKWGKQKWQWSGGEKKKTAVAAIAVPNALLGAALGGVDAPMGRKLEGVARGALGGTIGTVGYLAPLPPMARLLAGAGTSMVAHRMMMKPVFRPRHEPVMSGGGLKKAAAIEQGGYGVYLPADRIKRMKASKKGREELAAAARKKAKANREGRQYSSHGLAAGTSLKKKSKKKEASVNSKKELLRKLFGAYKKFEKSKPGKVYRAASVAVNPATAGTYEALALTSKAAGKAADYVGPTLADTMKKNPEFREAVMTAMTKMSHVSNLEKVAMKQKLKKIVKELLGASKKHKGQAMRIKALIGKMKTSAAKRDPRLERAGVSTYNKPKRTPGHPTKSHIVVAKDGDQIRTIRFGQQGVKTNQTAGQREAFKSRHRKNIARGKMSAAYWADRAKWSPSKTKDKKNKKWVKGS